MNAPQRHRFDALLERVLDELPPNLHRVLDEIPVIVLDRPSDAMLTEIGVPRDEWPDERESLCGLHTGLMLTERSIEHSAELPTDIHLFRVGIVNAAGGWTAGQQRILDEIRITLLHEIGHHFGLDEDDLDRLGYA
ncbi:MAG: metallopeptidase family protein [Phycisphaerales bacterium]